MKAISPQKEYSYLPLITLFHEDMEYITKIIEKYSCVYYFSTNLFTECTLEELERHYGKKTPDTLEIVIIDGQDKYLRLAVVLSKKSTYISLHNNQKDFSKLLTDLDVFFKSKERKLKIIYNSIFQSFLFFFLFTGPFYLYYLGFLAYNLKQNINFTIFYGVFIGYVLTVFISVEIYVNVHLYHSKIYLYKSYDSYWSRKKETIIENIIEYIIAALIGAVITYYTKQC